MAPRVARCCHRGARALLPPARHQAGLLGRPRAPRVPAEMGDRRGARYAPFRLPFSPRTRAFAFFASPVGRAKAATRARDLRVGEFRDERAHRFARDGPLLTSPSPRLPRLSPLICSSASADRQPGQRTGDVTLPLGVPRRGPARCVSFEATRHVAIEPRHRSRARDGDARLEPPRPSAAPAAPRRFPSIFKSAFSDDRVSEDADRVSRNPTKRRANRGRARSVTREIFFTIQTW